MYEAMSYIKKESSKFVNLVKETNKIWLGLVLIGLLLILIGLFSIPSSKEKELVVYHSNWEKNWIEAHMKGDYDEICKMSARGMIEDYNLDMDIQDIVFMTYMECFNRK